MGKNVIVVAPHPDDETLGCGGTLLRHIAAGDRVHWLIVTEMPSHWPNAAERRAARQREIDTVAAMYGFAGTHTLGFPATRLDTVAIGDLVEAISAVFRDVLPECVYVPYRGDVHTDHKQVFDAAVSCTKWFRYPSVKRVLAYETLSETEFGINPDNNGFRANVLVDISPYLERKLDIMRVFQSEMAPFPFPRSEQSLRALATLRGQMAGTMAAESFMLLKEIVS
ncbi:PIG-L deacetylase family protein [Paenibacillus cymbidii]|uniref:PIG-L deacetylase family protein n=1 Tax=Paenibacillus cymbidii TaxID=1639034 RepID=UPI001081B3DF|nr:PIG-L deacetylase family protein [Paenibacillus cymbidii]